MVVCISLGYLCPCNWNDFEDGRCYYVSKNSTSWQEAREYCRSYGGDLVVPRNASDIMKIYETMKTESVCTAYIGLYRVAAGLGHTFYTVRGAAPKYTYWYKGEVEEPNDYGGDEDCVEMVNKVWYFRGSQVDLRGAWNDVHCNGGQKFVCELSFKKYDD